jgi:hypothetical protein
VGTSLDPNQAPPGRELRKRRERWAKRASEAEVKDGNFGILGILNLFTQ